MASAKDSINRTLKRCTDVFEQIVFLLELDEHETVCGHASFGSSGNHVSSVLKVMKAVYDLDSTAHGPTKQNKLVKQYIQCLAQCEQHKEDCIQKPCFECAKRFCCEIFHVYVNIVHLYPSRVYTSGLLFSSVVEFKWIGWGSLHCSIGRYYYRNTRIFSVILAHYIAFCMELNRNLFDLDSWRLHPSLSESLHYFNVFPCSIVANLYRLKQVQWFEMIICQNVIATVLDTLYNHCQLMWNVFFYANNKYVCGIVSGNMHTLFIILVTALHFGRQKCREDLPKIVTAIPYFTHKFRCLLDVMHCDEYFVWFITSVVLILSGNDSDIFYRKIKQFGKKCKQVMDKKSKCNNKRCGKSRKECNYCCSQCKIAIYCSRTCQKYDWKQNHRALCSKYCVDPQRLYGDYGRPN
eukprot:69802_1